MLSQLLVVDFSCGNRSFSFRDISGYHEGNISLETVHRCSEFLAVMFNYDRIQAVKPKLQLMWFFEDDSDETRERHKEQILDQSKRFAKLVDGELCVVEHGYAYTLCEYNSSNTERLLCTDFKWLTETTKGVKAEDEGPSLGRDQA